MVKKVVSIVLSLAVLLGVCVPAGAVDITDKGLETSAEIFVESPERTDDDTLFEIEEPAKNDRTESTAKTVRNGTISGQELIVIIGYKTILRVAQIAQNSLAGIS